MAWLAFSYSLPTQAQSSPRVTLWRRLRRLGAVSLTGTYILPARPECEEGFVWLAEEVRHAQGEALVMKVDTFAGMTEADIVSRFQAARKEDYTELDTEVSALVARLAEDDAAEARRAALDTLARLRRRHAEVQRVDYFDSCDGALLAVRLNNLARTLRGEDDARVTVRDRAGYQQRIWVTRPQPHVDRLASIWLIRRRLDPHAVIHYRDTVQAGEVSFDMADAEFGHVGNLCTFEVMLATFGFSEPSLQALAEVVHEIDLDDGRYHRPETLGVSAILEGWRHLSLADETLEAHGLVLFDGLHHTLRQLQTTTVPERKPA